MTTYFRRAGMRRHVTTATLFAVLNAQCSLLALAQTASGTNSSDRGFAADSGGLVSPSAASTSVYAFSGVERGGANEAAAAARGRASAKAAGLKPTVTGGKKAEMFPSPEAATQALIGALRAGDSSRLEAIFAVQSELISSGDEIADRALRERFLREYDRKHSLEGAEAGMVTLIVGESGWPFAVPIVQKDEGFYFNSAAGANEVVFRRIGRNELSAIAVCRGYVDAQEDYALVGHDGHPAGRYAQKLMSDEGKQNGLFWPVRADALRSPAGPLLAAAAEEGYSADAAGKSTPYHGYRFRPLTAQGRHAQGGAKSYISSDGKQVGGFALVAYPAEYGRSGVKSFIVNQDGIVYEKDLGKRTAQIAREMREFDPKGWSRAPE
jgi:hypothetical protein